MPKRLIKRLIPDQNKIRDHKKLRWLGKLLEDPNLLHLNRYSVSGAVSVGLFVALVPAPFQMLMAAVMALFIRVNLPISVIVVWVSNPITMPPIFYFTYLVGAKILQVPLPDIQFEFTTEWFMQEFGAIWEPLLLGSLLVGLICAVVGNIVVRIFWRMHVIKSWKLRKAKKLKKLAEVKNPQDTKV
ncbi:MAG: DUF2062 domain-containing protein [Gammaproteobacteria bacterium]|nr:DUF2062 domain-containing protein [Gammaproteobacteria bacterium]